MVKFTTRVELHDADDRDDYDRLHAAMEAEGFTRTIESSGTTYHLPTAEYNLEGPYTAEQVRAKAAVAAKETGKRFAILVTPAAGSRYWQGLTEAD